MNDNHTITKITFNGRHDAYLVKIQSKQVEDTLQEYIDIICKIIVDKKLSCGSVFERILKNVEKQGKKGNKD